VSTPPATAIILAGAVAKGAFQAGVLEVVAARAPRIARIVATSAGALNGAVLAVGVRFGRLAVAAEVITRTWLEHATWQQLLRPSLAALRRGGLSSSAGVGEAVEAAMTQVVPAVRDPDVPLADVHLQMVTAALQGKPSARGPRAAAGDTTFEHVVEFAGASLDTAAGRAAVVHAASASAAFPGLFAPVELPPVGPCLDGGAVDNTPVSYALESLDVGRVVVVTDNPQRRAHDPALRGWAVIGRTIDIVINERLFRDLAFAHRVNAKLAELDALTRGWGLSDDQRAALADTLGWRPIELIQVRPERSLEGSPFAALADRRLRAEYIAEGRRAAERALAALP